MKVLILQIMEKKKDRMAVRIMEIVKRPEIKQKMEDVNEAMKGMEIMDVNRTLNQAVNQIPMFQE